MDSIKANYEFNILYNQMSGIYHNLVKDSKLSECQFWILYALTEENKPLTQSELSSYLISPKQTIHSSLNTLLTNNLISLTETNGRKKYYSLTKKGKELSNSTVLPIIKKEIDTFNFFTENERNKFINLFNKFVKQLDYLSKESL